MSIQPLFILLFLTISLSLTAQTSQNIDLKRSELPNGWAISHVGRSLPLGDLPLNMAVSRQGKLLAVTNNGQSVQSIQLIDPATEKQLDSVVISRSWYGLQFSADGKQLYASGGNDNIIWQYSIINKKLILTDSFVLGKKWPNKISPAGIEINTASQTMYVVTKEDNSLYIIDLPSKSIKKQIKLEAEAFSCILSNDQKELYITCWGCDQLLVLNTATEEITATVKVGSHPNDIILSKNGNYLFVANANDNSVSIINRKERSVVEVLNAALYPDAPVGSTTNGLALSADGKRLYIANADNNCLAVFDVTKPGSSVSLGYIPTGWYPTNVKVIGRKIFVANGKGFSSLPNPYGPNPVGKIQEVKYRTADNNKPPSVQYIGGLFKGTMSIIDEPSQQQLSFYSREVYRNTPYTKETEMKAKGQQDNPIPMKVGDKSPIKYVFYIIKENRTYDQVLADVPQGNGDTSLLLFGKHITPNQHKLVDEFVLLDNFYVDAEVSADGHNWSLGAYATDYLEKTWPTSYGGRGGDYDGEGRRKIANNKNGFIWDACKRSGVSFRTYGEFMMGYKPTIPVLQNNYCPTFNSWDEMQEKDTARFRQWRRDFDSLVAINRVPQFNTIRFLNDHTEGMRRGRPTPFAHVADNDLAVGLFIEHLSKSPIWNESVVLIVEDDAQNGADHVDAHRSTAYLAGPYVKRKFVDHTMYSSASMLRTIELILGIPPMTQYDAAATPLWNSFTSQPDFAPFQSVPSNINLQDVNIVMNEWQRRSEGFDFSKEDAVPDLEFNLVLWHAIKGSHVPFPGPRRAAFIKPVQEKDEDD
ncbi:bifunctional YncE family protein/alkaline phosphatase family protein [Chitinophagaceae bacterium LB-8]|uniref:Bifunctional YncE family protein/alkaline phosphatase family protein n=1 Tax=Paraflavisolibacter caeni TaxID=2982496 RepID=A0A9X2XYP4_9BACT|nr:bifunctional YncE family protein/alkaline phosphatase family protein [Paraflavisolibacter caeni]MCU7551974.1 bifunctional YncE family protein/alkaline phosphatase family protein [Paraflavisolibacter caeni]